MYSLIIRFFDAGLSLCGLIFLAPLLLVIFLFGLFDTGRPLFVQVRLGRGQQEFKLIKFRSMRVGTVQVATHLVESNQITSFGHFLRRSKLDELPQLWNVLIGDMSLVGPRPGLSTQTLLRKERHSRGVYEIRPGITGLGQINLIDMSNPRKLSRYDQLMIRNASVCFYIKIILQTIRGKGGGDRVQ